MTKGEIQKEYGVTMLMNPNEVGRELSEKEEIAYRKFLSGVKSEFDNWEE